MKKITLIVLFLLAVKLTQAQTTYESETGEITLSSDEYVDNVYLEYYIDIESSNPVLLNLTYNIEQGYDYLYVYECDDSFESLSLLATYDGEDEGELLVGSNGKVVIIFEADGGYDGSDIGEDGGYTITWEIGSATTIPEVNSLSTSGQVLIGQVDSNANLLIMDYNSKSLGDVDTIITDYDNSMILLESDYGNKLGFGFNKIGANGNLGIVSDGSIYHYADDFQFSTPSTEGALKIYSNGKLGINNSSSSSSSGWGYLSVTAEGEKYEKALVFSDSSDDYQIHLGNGGGEIGSSWFGCLGASTIDPVPALYLYGDNTGGDTGEKGVVIIDGRINSGSASDNQKVIDFWSGYGNRLAYINGDGSFYANGNVDAADTVKTNMLTTEGSVGIGTTAPESRLHISEGRNALLVNGLISGDNLSDYQAEFTFTDTGVDESGIKINKKNGATNFDLLNAFYNGNELFVIRNTGYVGIGTDSPEYKLDVSGTMRADEILVEDIAASNLSLDGNLAANTITVKANGNTADFVFEEDYDLKDLSEVESFIKTNKHLPDIPSAAEMEEQGVNLAEMNKLLLQKLEELTLYSISQDKKVEDLEERLKKLESILLLMR
jgi:hypothetical protein